MEGYRKLHNSDKEELDCGCMLDLLDFIYNGLYEYVLGLWLANIAKYRGADLGESK